VLLSGNVPDPKFRIEAERIAWSAPNIIEIGNEIKIKSSQGFVRNTKDGILNKSVKTRLIASKDIKARNFNVETHDGIVYLLGVARTQEELERAARIASTTRGAREVVSYVKLADNAPAAQPQYPAYQPSGANISAAQAPQYQAPQYQAPQPQQPQYRPLPQGLSLTPSGPPAGAAIPLSPPANLGTPVASGVAGRSFPSDEALGKYRVGTPGEAVSVIESEPYYVDPETGKEIPIKYLKSGPR